MQMVATENNPRPLRRIMPDTAEYWVKTDGDPFTMKFPAKIERCGQFDRLGPYSDLPLTGVRCPFNSLADLSSIIHIGFELEINALKKARAQKNARPGRG